MIVVGALCIMCGLRKHAHAIVKHLVNTSTQECEDADKH